MRLGTRYRGVIEQVDATTSGLISASPVGPLFPLLVHAVSWITFLDPVVRPRINFMVEVILLDSLVLLLSLLF